MKLDDIRVAPKLWGTIMGLLIVMLAAAAFTQNRASVAMLTALGKQNELKGHVRGALNNGATVEEIQEVLLHATVYCGVPAAVEAFRSANEVVSAGLKR